MPFGSAKFVQVDASSSVSIVKRSRSEIFLREAVG